MNKKGFSFKLVDVLTARNAEQFSKDTVTAIANVTRGHAGIDAVMQQPAFKEMQSALLKGARIADSKQDKGAFIAVKVLVKLVAALSAIGQGRAAELDPYTRCIVANLITLDAGITNKSALVSLSKSVEYDELEQQQSLKTRYNCSAGTATTQASSTRMMLHYLGVCTVSKGKRGDVMTFAENERAAAVRDLFTVREVREAVTGE